MMTTTAGWQDVSIESDGTAYTHTHKRARALAHVQNVRTQTGRMNDKNTPTRRDRPLVFSLSLSLRHRRAVSGVCTLGSDDVAVTLCQLCTMRKRNIIYISYLIIIVIIVIRLPVDRVLSD